MKEEIIRLLKEGKTYKEIVSEVGCTKSTISHHAKNIGLARSRFFRKDWESVQKDLDCGLPQRQCMAKYSINNNTWWKARKTGKIVTKEINPFDAVLAKLTVNSKCNNHSLKQQLIKFKVLENKCVECGLEGLWNNKPISLQLDHINGIKTDNRIENLRILCPNCHTQTDTFGTKNWGFQKSLGGGQTGKVVCL